jgi:hypothetical protein
MEAMIQLEPRIQCAGKQIGQGCPPWDFAMLQHDGNIP